MYFPFPRLMGYLTSSCEQCCQCMSTVHHDGPGDELQNQISGITDQNRPIFVLKQQANKKYILHISVIRIHMATFTNLEFYSDNQF